MLWVLYLDQETSSPPPPSPKETIIKHSNLTLKYCDEDTGQHGEEHLSVWWLAYNNVHCSPVESRGKTVCTGAWTHTELCVVLNANN